MGRLAQLNPQWDNSCKRWYISVPERLSSSGKRQRKYFGLKDEAQTYSKRIKKLEQQNASLVRKASKEVIEAAVYFDELFQLYGFSGIKDACLAFEGQLRELHRSKKCSELIIAFEEEHFSEWSDKHQDSWKTTKSIINELMDEPLSLLNTQKWREFFRSKADKRGWSAKSYNYYLGRISAIYVWGVKNDYCKENPIEAISRKKAAKKPVSILTAEQARLILHDAFENDRELVPYFAIGMFAGLRPQSELESLTWEDINFEEKWIRVGFGNKTDTKRFVPIEDNLLNWLRPWTLARGKVCAVTNLVSRRRAITRGKYRVDSNSSERDWVEIASWKQRDIMRHSYGSYLEAKYRDRNIVKENMGHTDFKTYEQHYRNARTPKQASEYWEIIPPDISTGTNAQLAPFSKAS